MRHLSSALISSKKSVITLISSGFVKNNRTKLKQVSFWSYCPQLYHKYFLVFYLHVFMILKSRHKRFTFKIPRVCVPASLQLQLYSDFSLLQRLFNSTSATLYFDFTSKLQLRHQSPSLVGDASPTFTPSPNGGTLSPLTKVAMSALVCAYHHLGRRIASFFSCSFYFYGSYNWRTSTAPQLWPAEAKASKSLSRRRCPPPILQPPSPIFLLSPLSQNTITVLPLYILYIL